jgi:hypothetical protein
MDRAWHQDMELVGRPLWDSVWKVRRARRQLHRQWARRDYHRSRNHIKAYCEYVARDGYYGAPWLKPEG